MQKLELVSYIRFTNFQSLFLLKPFFYNITFMGKFDLKDRLIEYSVAIINISNEMSNTKAGNHLANQLIRSGTSAALNYGEAQSGESRKDFIHKIKVTLKELRETYICLKIIHKSKLCQKEIDILDAISETNELISIFVKSAETAQKNDRRT